MRGNCRLRSTGNDGEKSPKPNISEGSTAVAGAQRSRVEVAWQSAALTG